jgi:predicted GH43/DUF377 family glycosyl hydrolase
MFVTRLSKRISPNPDRVILQYFNIRNEKRIINVIRRVIALPEPESVLQLEKVMSEFSYRHINIKSKLLENYKAIEEYVIREISDEKKLLLGAYFSKEYSIEAASLFNPSIVPHPDQRYLKPGMLRFIMSFRATGEGHISSIEFRSGVIDENCEIYFDETSRFCELPVIHEERFVEKELLKKILPVENNIEKNIVNSLPEQFNYKQVKKILGDEFKENVDGNIKGFITKILNFTQANYDLSFNETTAISERIIFPHSGNESVGMEDARFVKFTDDDGSVTFYATYTAYNGWTFGTQLIETKDFFNFSVRTLQGSAIKDKGMALFPRKVNGKYVMSSRQDGENLNIMFSDDLYTWNDYQPHYMPTEPWEFIQTGNCGSPIETKEGWLLITHAVGAFRKYSIGALLLDLEDPLKILGRLNFPLIEPLENEREGYVPNVVYSCGSIVHNGELLVPYAMSDSYTGFAKISLSGLLAELTEKI